MRWFFMQNLRQFSTIQSDDYCDASECLQLQLELITALWAPLLELQLFSNFGFALQEIYIAEFDKHGPDSTSDFKAK